MNSRIFENSEGTIEIHMDWPIHLEFGDYESVNRLLAMALDSMGGKIASRVIGDKTTDYFIRHFHILCSGPFATGTKITRQEKEHLIDLCRNWKRVNGYEND